MYYNESENQIIDWGVRMKAAVYHGKHDIRVEEVADKSVGENQVLIDVKYCGVCGTDMHIYNGEGGSFEVNPPLIPGHEFSGIVREVGSKVTKVQVGDHVSGDPNIMCGECYYCRSGMEHFCTNNIGIGTTADGGFAEQILMNESHVFKVPDDMDFKVAAMTEPVSCCLHGIDLCQIKAGDTVLVIGGGPIGMIMLQLAKMAGAAKVALSEPVESKRKIALDLGADLTIDPRKENVKEVLADFTENVNVVIECVGNVHTQEDAIDFAGMGATVMFFGLGSPEDEIAVKPDQIFKKELRITSSFINPYTFPRAIAVLATGKLYLTSIISTIFPLDDIERAFTDPELRKDGKIMIEISKD